MYLILFRRGTAVPRLIKPAVSLLDFTAAVVIFNLAI